MDFSTEVAVFIAFASLLVSILSFIYSRRAFNLDRLKYEELKTKSDIFIDVTDTNRYFYDDTVVLVSQLSISNNLKNEIIIRSIATDTIFKKQIIPGLFSFELKFSVAANSSFSSMHGTRTTTADKIIDKLILSHKSEIRSYIREFDSKNTIQFDGAARIESGSRIFILEIVNLFPKKFWLEMKQLGYKIKGNNIRMKFNNNIDREILSDVVRLAYGELDKSSAEKMELLSAIEDI